MYFIKKYFLTQLIFFFYLTCNSSAQTAFVDVDFLFKNSNLGKIISSKLENLNSNNLEILKKNETKLLKEENEIKKIKNLISEEEFSAKVNDLRNKFNEYKNEKKKLESNFNETKNIELLNFFEKINPIIQEYMNNKNINLLLEKKNIFIGKSENDITTEILKVINNKFK